MSLVTTASLFMYVFGVLGSEHVDRQRSQDFDGLRMVVRFEVDACLPYDATSSTSSSQSPVIGRTAKKKKSSSGPPPNPRNVKIIRAGSSQVPQTHLLEIKTHQGQRMNWSKAYPQLFLSQTPHIHHAFHKQGTFTSVKKFTLGQSGLADVDKNAQVGFKKLRKLLGYIKSLVLEYGVVRISLVCVGKTLSVYRIPQGESCLPGDALAHFIV